MKLLGNLLATALLSLGVTHIPAMPIADPKFRGPTPERTTRPRAAFRNEPYRRETPKPPSKRDLHRAAVAAKKRAKGV